MTSQWACAASVLPPGLCCAAGVGVCVWTGDLGEARRCVLACVGASLVCRGIGECLDFGPFTVWSPCCLTFCRALGSEYHSKSEQRSLGPRGVGICSLGTWVKGLCLLGTWTAEVGDIHPWFHITVFKPRELLMLRDPI